MHRHIWSRRIVATVGSAGVVVALGAATAAAEPETGPVLGTEIPAGTFDVAVEPAQTDDTDQEEAVGTVDALDEAPETTEASDDAEDEAGEAESTPPATDWLNATLTVPAINGCPDEATVTFEEGKAETDTQVYRFAFDGVVKYGDVTGDGNDEALILLDCGPRDAHYTGALVAFSEGDEGIEPVGVVVNPATWTERPIDFTVWHGDIAVAMIDIDLPAVAEDAGEISTEYYRWSADTESFERIDN
ncbi:hypothetical protein [Hoyosella altamirensis]|uniref:Secreted protein n=1 Tax=Hoyosella altamirensis TaxID=616997 RepID=A0A839RL34_9ACTN|nr:hypothetical protein [Hoyosella altamirensis]MBB3037180.1 hypothetical protein [Hoyosella altamirensis]